MKLSELIQHLANIQQKHGDLPCFVYSTDQKRDTPLITESVVLSWKGATPVFGQKDVRATSLSFSAIMPWFEEAMASGKEQGR